MNGWYAPDPARPVFVAYQNVAWAQTDDEARQFLAADFSALGGGTLRRVLLHRAWDNSAHVETAALDAGFYERFEALWAMYHRKGGWPRASEACRPSVPPKLKRGVVDLLVRRLLGLTAAVNKGLEEKRCLSWSVVPLPLEVEGAGVAAQPEHRILAMAEPSACSAPQ